MNRWKKHILILFAAILMNICGRYLALSLELPAYLNLCGTFFAAYLAGPVSGAAAAAASCALACLFSPGDLYFLIADIAVAVAAGLIAKKNAYFSKFSLIISATAFFACIRAAVILPIDLGVYGGRSGFIITDAVIDYLGSLSSPSWLRYTVAALFIGFTDVLAAMLLIWFGMHIRRNFGKRKRAAELKKQLRGSLTAGLLLVLFSSLLSDALPVRAEDPISFVEKLYNSENGLVGGCLNDIAMTRDGSMWIATYGGLFRFNGSRFILMDNLQSVRSVQSLFVDEEDRLWAGTQDAGVTLLNIDMSWRTLDMDTGLPSNSVKCISRDSNGLYYFGTTGGLVTAEYDNGEVRILKTIPEAGNIRDLSPDKNGHMIAMTNLGEISCYKSGELLAALELSGHTPRGIKHRSNGAIYIGTESETILIYEFRDGAFHKRGSKFAKGMKTVRDFCFDESGIIYVAADNGIGYYDSTGHFTMIESGEFNNSIDHVFRDYQGNIWFTSSRCGLLCLGRSGFTDVFKLCNEKNTVCNAIRNWNGYYYVATNDGLRILDVNAGVSLKNNVTAKLSGVRIRSMEIAADGNLLLATYGMGLMEVTKDGRIFPYLGWDGAEENVRLVSVLSDGTVISSSDAGMLFTRHQKVKARLRLGKDLGGGTILNIFETEDHTLLCGTDGDGIAVIRDAKPERYITREDGLSSGVILRIVKDEYADGYFVLTGSGLCYMDPELNIRELKMPYYNNFDIAVNDNREIFVLGGAGIYICDYDALLENGSMDTYVLLDSKAGLPGSITSNAWNYITEDEQIYICGTGGVYRLNLNNYEVRVGDYRTKITSIKRDGVFEDVTQIGTITIPRGTERIEFDLEINNYTTSDPYVSYYLNGVDKEKTTVLSSKLGSVTYYDIPYGEHDFVINVLDDKGRILASQTYVFSKERELYENTAFLVYFYIMLFTFIAFIVTSIVQGALWSQQKKEKGRHEQVVSQLEREKTEALERALHMEEDANRTKSAFLANMSHEIRTPINAIIGMDTMIMRESKEAAIRTYARDILSAGKTLLSLINDILDFSKIESGKLELVLGEYRLSGLLNGIMTMIAPKAESKKLELEVNVDPDTPDGLYGDEVRIEQIIINILNNAVKYTEKGKVSLDVAFEEAEGGAIVLKLSVTDTGIGIRAEDLEKLFSPYERIEEQRNKKIEGTGLGMSITKNLLEKMGSRLEVSSVYGEGSTFSFRITQPVINAEKIGDFRERAEEETAVPADTEHFHAPDAQLLVVDDVDMNLIVARNLLKRIRVQLDTVQSGKEAVERAKEKAYDIILLDSMMPGMNGEETMHSIRSQCPLNAETPIIVLTAHAVKGAREEYLSLGYTNYLSKPLDGVKLEAMIQSYLPDEKIIFVEEEMQEAAADTDARQGNWPAAEDSELSRIAKIDGIDTAQGMETAGGEEAYILICRNFHDTAKMRIGMIKEYFEKEEYGNYTIQVHALKSSARLIGALAFSEEALALETAGREGDTEKIRKDTEGILKKYEWFYEQLDEIFGEKENGDDDREAISEDELKERLSEMAELLEAFDFDTAKELFDTFADVRLPNDFKEIYGEMKTKMAELDRDGMLALISGGSEDD